MLLQVVEKNSSDPGPAQAAGPPSSADDGPADDDQSYDSLLRALAAAPPIAVQNKRLTPGTAVGGFRINGVLGAGSMGVVYEAFDLTLERRVALKLHARASRNVRDSRMWREAKAMARLTHPNVLAVYEVGEYEGQVFIAMELVQGGTLGDWLGPGPAPATRSWQEILDVFIQAAEGLAAAHAVNLVHRDFKPDNVLVDRQGRVRVADFGLALGTGDESRPGPSVPDDRPRPPSVDARVTETGMTVGTPAYMAPEQHTRAAVDHHSDQFSYCVALFEALYGVRPYDADTVETMADPGAPVRVRDPVSDRTVPAWLRAAVLRGLAAAPKDRYPSMPHLLAALRDDPSRRRRRVSLAAGVVAALGVTAWITRAASVVQAPCQDMGAPMAAVWNPQIASQTEQALRSTGSVLAQDAADRVRPKLDAYSDRWGELRTEACYATRGRGEQSEAMLDRRMLCLQRRRQQFEAIVAVLSAPDITAVEHAVQTVDVLDPLEACGDLEALQAQFPPPDREAASQAVHEVQLRLATVAAKTAAGRAIEVRDEANATVQRAIELGHPPLLASAHFARFQVEDSMGERDTALADVVAAHRFATQVGDARMAWRTALAIARSVGNTPQGTDDGLRWMEIAEGWSHRFAVTMEDRGHAARVHADVLQYGDRLEDALVELRRSLAMAQNESANQTRQLASSHTGIAVVLQRLARLDEARKHALQGLELAEELHGINHPRVGTALSTLAQIERRRGDTAAALRAIDRSLTIRRQTTGPTSLGYAAALRQRAGALKSQGKIDEAIADYELSLALLVALDQRVPKEELMTIGNLAIAFEHKGEQSRALEYNTRALDRGVEAYGVRSTKVATIRLNYGGSLAHAGRHADAIEQFVLAIEVFEELLGPNHPRVGIGLLNLGLAANTLGRLDEARQYVDRATRIFARHFPPTHVWPARIAREEAILLAAEGRTAEALQKWQQAMRQLEAALSATNPETVRARYRYGSLLLTSGDALAAIDPLSDVVRTSAEIGLSDDDVGEYRFQLAKALWADPARRTEANEQATQAARLMDAAIPKRAEVARAWAAAHPPG